MLIDFTQFVDESGQRDLMKGLAGLLPGLIGEDSKLVSLLKVANQSVIAPGMSPPEPGRVDAVVCCMSVCIEWVVTFHTASFIERWLRLKMSVCVRVRVLVCVRLCVRA